MTMSIPLALALCVAAILVNPISCLFTNTLTQGSSISVQNPQDNLQTGLFSAGFHHVGDNAYTFAIWFSSPSCPENCTVVWMANRDFPVNGRRSKLVLTKTGNLVLTDASSKSVAWSTNTNSKLVAELVLEDCGNLVLKTTKGDDAITILWQSFDYPTDTLLPSQKLTKDTQLVSSRSSTSFSSGFYKLLFDANNILNLVYDGPDVSSIYWPDPEKLSWDNQRYSYNNSRTASFDSLGNFSSSDNFSMVSVDHGKGFHRKLTLDPDGNLRFYSRDEGTQKWSVSGQAIEEVCTIHGLCGPNSTCIYKPESGRRCSCLPGYKMRNSTDWSYGCKPEFNLSCPNQEGADFIRISHQDFYGYDIEFVSNISLSACKKICLESCSCKGFQYKMKNGALSCYPKSLLFNGLRVPSFQGNLYVKINNGINLSSKATSSSVLDCPDGGLDLAIHRTYSKSHGSKTVELLLVMAVSLLGIEVSGVLLVWMLLVTRSAKKSSYCEQLRFHRFTYLELKKATRNFKEELGRGAGGIVYKGKLPSGQIVAIKKLYGPADHRGEAEFFAEISSIGGLNHINLIQMKGYCAEGKHRLLVYEYMENGSLAQNLASKSLTWEMRFNIALGTARGLAYLHEECLEWVLHCDVKPQNILLDADYQPKVSDFGLSKLLNRSGSNKSSFSRIRGTRGYMAPEWISNLPISSKVDVYSYGVVVLEMLTRKDLMAVTNDGGSEHKRVVEWVRNMKNGIQGSSSWVEKMMDPMVQGEYDLSKIELLVTLALQCVEEDRDARPTMAKVVEMLLQHQNASTTSMYPSSVNS